MLDLLFIFLRFSEYILTKKLGGNMKNKNRNHNPISKNESPLDRTLRSALVALVITACISALLVFVGAFVVSLTDDPLIFIEPVGYVTLYLASFFGGFASSKLNKSSAFLTSLLCGAGFVLISMLLSLCLPHTLASGLTVLHRLLLHLLSLACFPVGALAGIKAAKSPSKHKKYQKRHL